MTTGNLTCTSLPDFAKDSDDYILTLIPCEQHCEDNLLDEAFKVFKDAKVVTSGTWWNCLLGDVKHMVNNLI